MQIFGSWVVLTLTRFPCDNHHLVIAHGFENRLFFLANRQVIRISDRRSRGFAQQDSAACSISCAIS
jgi:hypothetical protein